MLNVGAVKNYRCFQGVKLKELFYKNNEKAELERDFKIMQILILNITTNTNLQKFNM